MFASHGAARSETLGSVRPDYEVRQLCYSIILVYVLPQLCANITLRIRILTRP